MLRVTAIRLLSGAAGAVLAMALAGCAASPAINLANTHWKLTAINGKPVQAGVAITLDFTDSTIGGFSGCNSYGGSYRLAGNQLTFPQSIVSTLMACQDENIMALEATFTGALAKNPRVAAQNGRLTLTSSDGTTLTFAPR